MLYWCCGSPPGPQSTEIEELHSSGKLVFHQTAESCNKDGKSMEAITQSCLTPALSSKGSVSLLSFRTIADILPQRCLRMLMNFLEQPVFGKILCSAWQLSWPNAFDKKPRTIVDVVHTISLEADKLWKLCPIHWSNSTLGFSSTRGRRQLARTHAVLSQQ